MILEVAPYYIYIFTLVITAYYLDLTDIDSVEYFQYLKRAAANPIILGEAGDPRKMYMIGDLADYYKRKRRTKEAQILIKHVIDSNIIPADLYRFYLAESYTHTKDYDKAAEILSYLYCKRAFKADPEQLSIFEEHN